MGYLEIVIGPMFSGKTKKLIETAKKAQESGASILVVNHISDKRYSQTMLSTHDKIMFPCKFLASLDEALNEMNEADAIFINEAQFFDADQLVRIVEYFVNRMEKSVYVYGLDGDYLQKPIGGILNLVPICDKIEKLYSQCSNCRERAIYSVLKDVCVYTKKTPKAQIIVGGENEYMVLCRYCWRGVVYNKEL